MRAEGFTTPSEGSLVCRVPDADWYFTIRRKDERTHIPFAEFNKKEVKGADVATKYLPNWEKLRWQGIKRDAIGKNESVAKDVEFKVIVHSTDEGSKTAKEIIEAFLDFMRST
jgi:hypothetical protein